MELAYQMDFVNVNLVTKDLIAMIVRFMPIIYKLLIQLYISASGKEQYYMEMLKFLSKVDFSDINSKDENNETALYRGIYF